MEPYSSISAVDTVNDADFAFTEVAAGGPSKRGKVVKIEEVESQGADHFTSLYGHSEDFVDYVNDPSTGKGKGSCRGYKGAVKPGFVPFDIDREEMDDALRDARDLLQRLHSDYGVPQDVPRIYFSGSKGFHVELPGECFGGLEASLNAPQKVKDLALLILDGMETDTAIYDRTRLWRSPNTINGKGNLYKVPLAHDELMNLPLSRIKELARRPRTVSYATPEPVPALVDLKDSTKITLKHRTPKVTDEETDNLVAVVQEYKPDKGERHLFARALVGYLLPRIKKPKTLTVVRGAWDGDGLDTIREVEDIVDSTADLWMNDEPIEGAPKLDERAPGIVSALNSILYGKSKPNTTTGVKISSAADLQHKHFKDPEYVIEGFVPEGVGLLAGKPKIGKSWMALGECIAVASGGMAYGSVEVKPGRALYLALEDSERRLQERLKSVLPGQRFPATFDYALEWPRVGEGCEEELRRYLESHPDTRLVYIDTLKKIRPRVKGSKGVYDADYEALETLLPLAAEFNVSIQVVHHLNKMVDAEDPLDTVSGSTGLTGGVDGVRVLNRTRAAADAVMFVTGRDVEERNVALTFDSFLTSWVLEGDTETLVLSRERKAIHEFFKDQGNPWLTPNAVAQGLGKRADAVRKLMGSMLKYGQLQCNGNHQYSVPSIERDDHGGHTDHGGHNDHTDHSYPLSQGDHTQNHTSKTSEADT